MIYLSYAELLYVAERAMGEAPKVRDASLLEAAAARPQTTVLGADAYPSREEKAAALTHSHVSHRALLDGISASGDQPGPSQAQLSTSPDAGTTEAAAGTGSAGCAWRSFPAGQAGRRCS